MLKKFVKNLENIDKITSKLLEKTLTTGLDALQKYAPTEEKKASQFSAFNQFPYTLEQEVVAKMAPVMQSGSSITQASFKPILDDSHDASPINVSN